MRIDYLNKKYKSYRTRLRLGLILSGIIITLISSSIYAGFSIITVVINSEKKYAISGVTVGRVLSDQGLPLKRGNIIDVKGNTILKEAGGYPVVLVNKKKSNMDIKLKKSDIITFFPAKHIQEKVLNKNYPLSYGKAHLGKGPFISITPGKDGVQEVSVGEISQKLVTRNVLVKPIPRTYLRQSYLGKSKVVALTFDDGPSKYTWEIIKILTKEKIPATFFIVGQQAKKRPDMIYFLKRYKFDLANHTQTHNGLTKLSFASAKDEIEKTAQFLKQNGLKPKWFRPPGGRYNDNILEIVNYLEMRTALWTIDSRDWKKPGAEKIANRVLSQIRPGSVILLHDGGGNRSQTVEALKIIIKKLFKAGYGFVSLDHIANNQ